MTAAFGADRTAVRYGIPAGVLLLLTAAIVALKLLCVNQQQGDSAIFLQTTENIAAYGTPTSSLYAAVWAYQRSRLDKMPARRIATNPLAPPPADADQQILRLHSYAVLLPLGWIARFLPSHLVLSAAFVLAFTGLIALVYLTLVRHGMPTAGAVLFALLVMTHPAWSESLLFGQFYPDRLFVFAGFALLALVASARANRVVLVAVALVCASINERGALIAGIALVLFAVLYWRSTGDRTFKLALGIALCLVSALIVHVVLTSGLYDSYIPLDSAHVLRLLHRPQFWYAAGVFSLVNLTLVAIAFFEWRAALIALAIMLPNLIGSIGGAEKIGWITHYHSFYFPVLVWAACAGFERAYRLAVRHGAVRWWYAGTVVALVFLSSVDPYALPPRMAPAHLAQTFVPRFIGMVPTYLGPQGRALQAAGDAVATAVPQGAIVSVPEAAMPFLYHARTLYFLPMGIERADYVVLAAQPVPGGGITYGGVVNLTGPEEVTRVNAAIVARLRADGYDLDHPVIVAPLGMAIVKHLRQ